MYVCWITFYRNYIYANIKYLSEWIEFFHNSTLEILNKTENKNFDHPDGALVDPLTLKHFDTLFYSSEVAFYFW